MDEVSTKVSQWLSNSIGSEVTFDQVTQLLLFVVQFRLEVLQLCSVQTDGWQVVNLFIEIGDLQLQLLDPLSVVRLQVHQAKVCVLAGDTNTVLSMVLGQLPELWWQHLSKSGFSHPESTILIPHQIPPALVNWLLGFLVQGGNGSCPHGFLDPCLVALLVFEDLVGSVLLGTNLILLVAGLFDLVGFGQSPGLERLPICCCVDHVLGRSSPMELCWVGPIKMVGD